MMATLRQQDDEVGCGVTSLLTQPIAASNGDGLEPRADCRGMDAVAGRERQRAPGVRPATQARRPGGQPDARFAGPTAECHALVLSTDSAKTCRPEGTTTTESAMATMGNGSLAGTRQTELRITGGSSVP